MIPVSPWLHFSAGAADNSGDLNVWVTWTRAYGTGPITGVRVENTSGMAALSTVTFNGVPVVSQSVPAGFNHTFTGLTWAQLGNAGVTVNSWT